MAAARWARRLHDGGDPPDTPRQGGVALLWRWMAADTQDAGLSPSPSRGRPDVLARAGWRCAHAHGAGRPDGLLAAVRKHLAVLTQQQLVSARPAYVMRATDGVIVEVVEWRSVEAVAQAHESPAVLALWAEFAGVCEDLHLAELGETQPLFAEFDAVAL